LKGGEEVDCGFLMGFVAELDRSVGAIFEKTLAL